MRNRSQAVRQITVDDQTYELAERLAARRKGTLQDVVSEAVSDAVRKDYRSDPGSIIGALSQDAELLDRVVKDAMEERETRSLRPDNG
jgi:hypothetical protein